MRAAQINAFGDKDALQIHQVPKPVAGPGQALVEVHAASVNPFDWKLRSGQVGDITFPATLGGDFSGVIVEIGEGATQLAVGQAVYGQADAMGGQGSFAEYTPVKVSSISPKPQGVDFLNAAALPLTAVSAYQALVDTLHLQSGQKILIHGGAGGIGGFAIQLAKHLGAHVVTTAAPQDVDYVRQLGAEEVIDYTSQKFEEQIQGCDAVFDTIGGDTYIRSFTVLKSGGQIVSMLEQPNIELAEKHHVTAYRQLTRVTTQRLEAITKLVDKGVLKITIDKVYPFEQVAEALEATHTEHHRGKILLEIKVGAAGPGG